MSAAADGLVVFAGPVAGGLHVTVLHADGVRTSYSFLAAIRVRQGDAVHGGDTVGVAAALLHVGARRGDTYIDPASLWGHDVGPPDVQLVPLDGRDVAAPAAHALAETERRWLVGTVTDRLAMFSIVSSTGVAEGIAS